MCIYIYTRIFATLIYSKSETVPAFKTWWPISAGYPLIAPRCRLSFDGWPQHLLSALAETTPKLLEDCSCMGHLIQGWQESIYKYLLITYSTYLGWIKALCRWISILARPQRLLIIKETDETAQIEAVHKDPSSRKQTIQDDRGIEYHASVVSEVIVFFPAERIPKLRIHQPKPSTSTLWALAATGHSLAKHPAGCFRSVESWGCGGCCHRSGPGLEKHGFFLGGGERSFVFFGWLENCWFSKRIHLFIIYIMLYIYIHPMQPNPLEIKGLSLNPSFYTMLKKTSGSVPKPRVCFLEPVLNPYLAHTKPIFYPY